jgi:hypothetical protein
MAKSSDNIRCIRKYPKKDGTFSFHAEVRRKGAKPLRQVFRTLTEAKNWVRSNETAILEGKLPQEVKARKYTVNDLIERFYASGGNREAYLAFLPFASFSKGFFGYVKKSEFIKAVTNKTKNPAEN